jgi:hypothetical protein
MRIDLHDSPFEGRTSPRPWTGPRSSLECSRCGSSPAGRREKVPRQTTAGIRYVVETFRCGCGRGRRVRREVASG